MLSAALRWTGFILAFMAGDMLAHQNMLLLPTLPVAILFMGASHIKRW